MIRINKNKVVVASHITQYDKDYMRETTYVIPYTYQTYSRGSFLNALFHLDFSKKDVTEYYAGLKRHLFYIGDWENVKIWCDGTPAHKIIDGIIYDMPYITIHLSDGDNYTIYLSSNEELKKLERKIIRKTKTI